MELQHTTADIRRAKYLHKNKSQMIPTRLKGSGSFFQLSCGQFYCFTKLAETE